MGLTTNNTKSRWRIRYKQRILVKRPNKHDNHPNQDDRMHACSIRSSPKQMPITRHTGTIGGTIRTLTMYTSRAYDPRLRNTRNVVSIPAKEHIVYI